VSPEALLATDPTPLPVPRLAVGVVVRSGDQVLLARHRHHADKRFALIAGFVEERQSVEEAARRDVLEETGLTVRVGANLGTFEVESAEDGPVQFVVLEAWAGSAPIVSSDELEEVSWFILDELPDSPEVVATVLRTMDVREASDVS
jgi:NADH pyrophosphatase NudC (nudix superfamily)